MRRGRPVLLPMFHRWRTETQKDQGQKCLRILGAQFETPTIRFFSLHTILRQLPMTSVKTLMSHIGHQQRTLSVAMGEKLGLNKLVDITQEFLRGRIRQSSSLWQHLADLTRRPSFFLLLFHSWMSEIGLVWHPDCTLHCPVLAPYCSRSAPCSLQVSPQLWKPGEWQLTLPPSPTIKFSYLRGSLKATWCASADCRPSLFSTQLPMYSINMSVHGKEGKGLI